MLQMTVAILIFLLGAPLGYGAIKLLKLLGANMVTLGDVAKAYFFSFAVSLAVACFMYAVVNYYVVEARKRKECCQLGFVQLSI